MKPIRFTDADSVERAERTYLVPGPQLSEFLRVVYAGFRHPRYGRLVSKGFTWEPADERRDRVMVIFLPEDGEVDENG